LVLIRFQVGASLEELRGLESSSRLSFKNVAYPIAVGNFPWRAAFAFEPFQKLAEPHFVLHGDISDADASGIQPFRNSRHPFVPSDCSEAKRYGLVKSRGGYLDRVGYFFRIRDGDATCAGGHNTVKRSIFAFYSPSIDLLGVRTRSNSAALDGYELGKYHKDILFPIAAHGVFGPESDVCWVG
jgi:hypothetical protein